MSTTKTKLLSVKVPVELYRAMPGAHKGRSRFIISALREKISRDESNWKPASERGRRLAVLLQKGAPERGEPLDAEGIARELRERRGALH
jgi:hypothetical protein